MLCQPNLRCGSAGPARVGDFLPPQLKGRGPEDERYAEVDARSSHYDKAFMTGI